MSGIVGVVRFDERPGLDREVKRMASRMPYRDVDGCSLWADSLAAMAHLRLAVTPESLREVQPYRDPATGSVLVADVRLDRRQDLAGRLGISRRAVEGPTDAELLMLAYLKWGDEAPKHLDGDFAFAIWDARSRSLFAAVDPFSVRTLYYHHRPENLFAFGSEPKAILALEDVSDALDEVRLAEVLRGSTTSPERTVFAAVRSLFGSHALRVSASGLRVWQYYDVTPAEGLGVLEGDKGVEAFRETFTKAVRDRTRSAFPVGAQLSGGLDSSSIAVVARDALLDRGEQLHTFSLIFDESPESDEREYAQAVIDQGGVEPHMVLGDAVSPLGNIEEVYSRLDDGPVGGTQHQVWALYQASKESGVRVVLDGIDGDNVVGHGQHLLRVKAVEGEWREFAALATQLVQRYQSASQAQNFEETMGSYDALFQEFGWPALQREAEVGSRVRFARSLRSASRDAGVHERTLLRTFWRALLRPRSVNRSRRKESQRRRQLESLSFLDRSVASRVGVEPHPRFFGADADELMKMDVQEQHRHLILQPGLTNAIRRTSLLAAFHGFDVAHPFMDKRLIELCLALPPEQKLHAGWTRYVLRKAMEGWLPDSVAWRVAKANMTVSVDRASELYDKPKQERLLRSPGWVSEYLDMNQLADLLDAARPLTEQEQTRLESLASSLYWLQTLWPNGPQGPSLYSAKSSP